VYNQPLVPDNFIVPEIHETDLIRLRPLTIHDAIKDYAALMESEGLLRTMSDTGDTWPTGLTLEQNMIELGWHQTEFQLRTSFAYTVVAHDESEVLWCMYIYPTRKANYDCKVIMWTRQSRMAEGLDQHLFETVTKWVKESWPFKKNRLSGENNLPE
jgi:hypothetical protein